MSKELKPLQPLQTLSLQPLQALDYLEDIAHGRKMGFDPHELKLLIETTLKDYQELLDKPCVLIGRNQGYTKALIDMISKNYKEIKITNLVDENKVKAFEIIKEKRVDITTLMDCRNVEEFNRWVPIRSHYSYRPFELTQEEFELLKEVLL